MAGELSPDRLFYWNGERWVSAVTPDGAWRWDGTSWQPAGRPTGATGRLYAQSRRLPWLIAAALIVSVVIVSVAVYFAWGPMRTASQRFLHSTTLGTCASNLSRPGASLATGDTLCGGKLGNEHVLADCTVSTGAPDGIDVWRKDYSPTEGEWVPSTVTTGPAGCNLAAAPDTDVSFDTSDTEPPEAVVVADFTVTANTGGIGIQLACSEESGCVDITVYSDGFYSLDEGRPNDGWDNMTKGYVSSLASPIKAVGANRMILRLTGKDAEVFINGVQLTAGTTKRDQSYGYVDFYLDNRDGKTLESVWLQRLYVFDSLPA